MIGKGKERKYVAFHNKIVVIFVERSPWFREWMVAVKVDASHFMKAHQPIYEIEVEGVK